MKGKRGILLCALPLALPAVRADQAAALPAHTVLKTERCDANSVTTRISVWVSVPDGLSRLDVQRVMAEVVTAHTNLHVVSVFVLREGERPGFGPYTVGRCEWAPYGDWSRAGEGLGDPGRKTYDIKVDLRDSYFAAAPKAKRPAMYGLTPEQMDALAEELQRETHAAEKVVWTRNTICNPPELKRAREAALARVVAKYKLTPAQADRAYRSHLANPD